MGKPISSSTELAGAVGAGRGGGRRRNLKRERERAYAARLAALAVPPPMPRYLAGALFCGYGFAWVGHFAFEKNRPASFKRPLYSLMGDWVMYKDIWTGRIAF